MLPKRQRLTKQAFDQYFKTGKRFHSDHLQLVYTRAEQFHGAVVVGKKVAKTAVARNRLRRRLYALLYRLHKTKNCHGIFQILTKPGAAQASFAALSTELSELVGRTGKIR